MAERKLNLISPKDKKLNSFLMVVLTTMLNMPESDYHTASELYCFFKSDTPIDIDDALNKLVDMEYLLCIDGRYAFNKIKITEMEII